MLRSGQVVVADFIGTGAVFTPGRHYHSGRVLKSGPVPESYTIRLFRPVLERPPGATPNTYVQSTVVTLGADEVRAV